MAQITALVIQNFAFCRQTGRCFNQIRERERAKRVVNSIKECTSRYRWLSIVQKIDYRPSIWCSRARCAPQPHIETTTRLILLYGLWGTCIPKQYYTILIARRKTSSHMMCARGIGVEKRPLRRRECVYVYYMYCVTRIVNLRKNIICFRLPFVFIVNHINLFLKKKKTIHFGGTI